MIYVFLDMDGVVLPMHPPYRPENGSFLLSPKGESFYSIWSECVNVLNSIGESYENMVFILNSTWKVHGDKAQKELKKAGFKYRLIDSTPLETGEYKRSNAVRDWFHLNGINKDEVIWVAIDDEFFTYSPKDRSCNLLITNPYTGLFSGNKIGFDLLICEQLEKLNRKS